MLPGKLQVVIKAQSIYLNPGEEYEGAWQCDKLKGDIVAIVLYYYRYSAHLEGGDLEFVSRIQRDTKFYFSDLDEEFYEEKLQELEESLPYAKVPMAEGTLVVLSNYQLRHRALRMVNHSNKVASRDLLVLYIVDQRNPLQSTQPLPECINNQAYEYEYRQEKKRFFERLKPRGRIELSSYLVQIGSLLMEKYDSLNDPRAPSSEPRAALHNLMLLDYCPPLHRRTSWIFDSDMWDDEKRKLLELQSFLDKTDHSKIKSFIVEWGNLVSLVDPLVWKVSSYDAKAVINKIESLLQIVQNAACELSLTIEDFSTLNEIEKNLNSILDQALKQLDS